jgi:hypothetical protein
MSTNINITVGDNALLDAAKQQQAANRQAQLNREASTRLEAQATAARTAALATQGRDANANLIHGALFTQPLIDRRPVANRQGYGALLTAPFTYVNYGGSNSGLIVRCRGNRNVPAARFSYEESKVYSEGVVVNGPTLGTFALEPAPAPNQPPATVVSGQRQDNGEFLTFTNYTESSTELPSTFNAYVVQSGEYDTVLDWQRGAFSDEIPEPPYNVINLTGSEAPVSGFRSLDRTGAFTHEFIMRMPITAFDDIASIAYTTEGAIVPIRSAGITVQFGGLTVTIGARDSWVISGGFQLDTFEPSPFGGTIIIPITELTRTSAFSVGASIFAPTFTDSDGEFLQGSPPVGFYPLSTVEPGDFVHCALSRYRSEAGFRWALHVNGTRLLSGIQEPSTWSDTYGTQPPSVRIFTTASRNRIAPTVLPVPALHASRFTPRAMYFDTFTPPSSITSFA